MIPKIIHYCWFSGEPFPVEIKSCMRTWKKILPDFSLRLWTMEDALDTNIPFVKEAITQKKWAFACDVIRAYAIYKEGGLYMDCDVRILKRFDKFLEDGNFGTFHECKINEFVTILGYRKMGLQAAFMFGLKDNKFCEAILNYYNSRHFLLSDGSLDMKIAPCIFAEIAENFGYKYINQKQVLDDNTIIYESKYLGETKRQIGTDTFAFHTIMHSWKSGYSKTRKFEKKLKHYYRVIKYFFFKV